MIGCGLLLVSLLTLVLLLGGVGFKLASGRVVTGMVDEGRTEKRSVLLKGRESLDDFDDVEVEG